MKKLIMPAILGLTMLTGVSHAHNNYGYSDLNLATQAIELQDSIELLVKDNQKANNIAEFDKAFLKTHSKLLGKYIDSYIAGGTSESVLMDLINRIQDGVANITNTKKPDICAGKQPYECAGIN